MSASKSDKGTPVKLAFLHQALCWPGSAGAEKTLSEDKIKGLKMTLLPQGLLLETNRDNKTKALVPHQNVANYVLDYDAL